MEAILICTECKHFKPKTFTCKAFPNGIKDNEIISGWSAHQTPTVGQKNEVVFQPKEKSSNK